MITKILGEVDYLACWRNMLNFNANRNSATLDEIWFLEHPRIYTTGLASSVPEGLSINNIQIIKSDRGGQITYHGPGQLIVYMLLDLTRLSYNLNNLLQLIYEVVLDVLRHYKISGHLMEGMPGVYVDKQKICSVGLRIKKGYSMHGFSLNIDMDLAPFSAIDPCGYPQLKMTQLKELVPSISLVEVLDQLKNRLLAKIDHSSGEK